MHNHTPGAPAPIAYSFAAFNLRVILIDDQPWFVATDVCNALDLTQPTNAIRSLDDDEATLTTIKGRTPSGGEIDKAVNIINESGLYSLVFKSRKPEAKKFKRWVTHEVLPSIRKTGQYIAKEDQAAPELMARLREKVRMAAHGFRFRHKAESAFYARIRAEAGANSSSKLTTAQCLHALDQIEQLVIGCQRHNSAVAKAEDDFLKRFVRGDNPMPLKPVLVLMEKDASREILPIPISDHELRQLTTRAAGSDVQGGLTYQHQEGNL